MRSRPKATALTVAEFFSVRRKGFSKSDAVRATKLAHTTIIDAAKQPRSANANTLAVLEEWSRAAIAEHGVFISAAKTLGLSEVA